MSVPQAEKGEGLIIQAVVNSVASQWLQHVVINEFAQNLNPHFAPISACLASQKGKNIKIR